MHVIFAILFSNIHTLYKFIIIIPHMRGGGGVVTHHIESPTSHIFLDPKVPLLTFLDPP